MKTTKQGWYFSTSDKQLRFGDNRFIEAGITHEVPVTQERPLSLCEYGLHASANILDALKYAPGLILYRVELSGDILEGNDKMCASKRTYVEGGIDMTEVLKEFSRACALSVVHLWDAPKAAIKFLKTGDCKYQSQANASKSQANAHAAYANAYAAYASANVYAAYANAYNAYASAYAYANAYAYAHVACVDAAQANVKFRYQKEQLLLFLISNQFDCLHSQF